MKHSLKLIPAAFALTCSLAFAQPACIPSGETDIHTYFVAVDATDRVTFETGLNTWTVYRSRNGAAEVAYTTPTITEIDNTNAPGAYELLIDEDTTIGSGNDYEPYMLRITNAAMVPVTKEICIGRSKITLGNTLGVDSEGDGASDVTEYNGVNATSASGRPEVNPTHWLGQALAAVTVNGVPEVDVTHFNGTAGTFASGRPEVNTSHWGGTAVASALVRGNLIQIEGTDATDVLDAITTAIRLSLGVTVTTITVTDQNTFVLAAGATYDDAYNGYGVYIDDAGSADVWLGKVSDYTGASKTIDTTANAGFTIATGDTVILMPAFLADLISIDTAQLFTEDSGETSGTAVAGSVVFEIGELAGAGGAPSAATIRAEIDANSTQLAKIGTAASLGGASTLFGNLGDLAGSGFVTATDGLKALQDEDDVTQGFVDDIGVAGAGLSAIPDQTINLTGTWTGNLTGSVGSVTGAVGSVTGSVGSVTTVNGLAANVITAASIANDAIGTTEASALATAAALSTAQTAITAIKAKTDLLVFTVTNQVDANVQSVNDVTVVGDGSGTPFNVSYRSLRKQMHDAGIMRVSRKQMRQLREDLNRTNGAAQVIRVSL